MQTPKKFHIIDLERDEPRTALGAAILFRCHPDLREEIQSKAKMLEKEIGIRVTMSDVMRLAIEAYVRS